MNLLFSQRMTKITLKWIFDVISVSQQIVEIDQVVSLEMILLENASPAHSVKTESKRDFSSLFKEF